MKKILIVNLTRFGDLLQTSPTIAGLKAQHPDAAITVVVDRNFADVARGLPGVDRVWPLDLNELGRTMIGGTGADLRRAYHWAEEQIGALRAEGFDLAVNYSSSKMSAVLLKMIGAPDTRGWTMAANGYRMIAHRWSQLFAASALTRRQAPFNLVDYYKRAAGVQGGPERLFYRVAPEARARAAAILADAGVTDETPVVALQLGASRAVRVWPVESFVALGRELEARIGARLLLCGGGGDRPLADLVAPGLGGAAIDVCGRTSVEELGALLERSCILVTSDTGPMHMAVAVGTPVVSLFFGPALPFDTGPYGRDHLCLHAEVPCAPCDHHITCLQPFCRETLAPGAVAEAVIARRAGDWAALAMASDRWPEIRWYRTGFDAEGLFDVTRIGLRPPTWRETLRRAVRAVWKATLDGTRPERPRTTLPREAAVLRNLVPLARAATVEAAAVETIARERGEIERLTAAARALEERDFELFRFGAIHEPAALILQMFRFEKENVGGEDVVAIATATRILHEALEVQIALLIDLLDPPPTRPDTAERGDDDHAHLA